MRALISVAVRACLDLVYPRVCAGCGAAVTDGADHVCWECFSRFRAVQFPHCSICGNPVWGAVSHEYVCSLCLENKRRFDKARSAVHFDHTAAAVIHAFKYSSAIHLADDLSRMLMACIRVHYSPAEVDAVTFVPLHPRKERERSYNQARLLASRVASSFGKAMAPPCLERLRETVSQTGLSAVARRENVHGAFRALNRRWIDGRRFLLVDDVMTTGATVDECAAVLKEAGAAAVRVATVARGVR